MKQIVYALALFIPLAQSASASAAEPQVTLRGQYGVADPALQSVLYFEDIAYETSTFSGDALIGRNYQVVVSELTDGVLTKTETVFDSKEDEYFRIKKNEFAMRTLAKRISDGKIRFEFQFDGFIKRAEFAIAPNHGDFALKDFMGSRPAISIPVGADTPILAYIMPYEKPDGSKQYCEVVQSGVAATELGAKYKIPRYYLISIKFDKI
jgi:hypothetical protein